MFPSQTSYSRIRKVGRPHGAHLKGNNDQMHEIVSPASIGDRNETTKSQPECYHRQNNARQGITRAPPRHARPCKHQVDERPIGHGFRSYGHRSSTTTVEYNSPSTSGYESISTPMKVTPNNPACSTIRPKFEGLPLHVRPKRTQNSVLRHP